MKDEGKEYTDKKLDKTEKQIRAVYGQAKVEIEEKMQDFYDKRAVKIEMYLDKLAKNEITQEQFNSWYAGQVFQGKQWEAKRDQIIGVLDNANQQAVNIVNGGSIDVFAKNANWAFYNLEKTNGVNFGFGLYDAKATTNLLVNNPQILPKWKIDEPKQYIWNKQKVNNCITQGIIQGESLDKIAKRIATVTSNQNGNLALTHARTAMTGAQNVGRVQALQDASKMGIETAKQWMATLDTHTRDSHQEMDGETQPVGDTWHPMKFSNGCRYPGDPLGPAEEVFNCRCTLVGVTLDYPAAYDRYDNINGVPIENMTYKEWEEAKKEARETPKEAEEETPYMSLDDYLDQLYPEEEEEESLDIEEITADDFIPASLDADVWIQECKNNPDVPGMLELEESNFVHFTESEKNALETYTGFAYEDINGYLRGQHDGGHGIKECAETCSNALGKVTLGKDMVLRRGTDVGDLAGLFMDGDFSANKRSLYGKTAEELNELFQGQIGMYTGFTSTSSQWNKGFSGNVEILFQAPANTHGSSIMGISMYGTGEGETLLANNTRVVCEGIQESDGHYNSSIRVFLRILTD